MVNGAWHGLVAGDVNLQPGGVAVVGLLSLRLGRAYRIIRGLGIGGWKVEFFRRSTFLIDARGGIAAVWGRVKIRGHAREVLELAQTLERAGG